MEAIYVIETNCDHRLRYRFTEIQHKSEYGNGKYVIIVNLDTHELKGYEDVRYDTNYDFETFCVNFIKQYYKTNLKHYFKEEY